MGLDGAFIILLIYFIFGLIFVMMLAIIIKRVFKIKGNSRITKKHYLLLKQIAIKLDVDPNKINEIDSL